MPPVGARRDGQAGRDAPRRSRGRSTGQAPCRSALVVTKGWNSRSASSGAMPGPVSATLDLGHYRPRASRVAMVSSRRSTASIASIALRTRFSTTCWICTPVDEDRRQAVVEFERDADPRLPGADQGEGERFLDQLVEALGAALGFAFADELAQLADDARQRARPGRPPAPSTRRPAPPVGAGREQVASGFEIIHYCGQRLVQLMRHRRGHLSHHAEPRGVQQFGVQFLQAVLGFLESRLGAFRRCDVAGDLGRADELAVAIVDRRDAERDVQGGTRPCAGARSRNDRRARPA